MAKTDWTLNDTVAPSDMNGIGEEINQLRDDVDSANEQLADVPKKTDLAATTAGKGASLVGVQPITGLTGTDVQAMLQSLFTLASDGKNAVAAAITGKGVPATGSDTFAQLATKIGQISTGKKFASGTFTTSNIAIYTASNSGQIQTGKLPEVTGLNFAPSIVIIISADGWIKGNAKANGVMASSFNDMGPNYYVSVHAINLKQTGFTTDLKVFEYNTNLYNGRVLTWWAFE